jgi:hypothetical protein
LEFEPFGFTWGFIPVFSNKGLWKAIVVYMLVEDYDTLRRCFIYFNELAFASIAEAVEVVTEERERPE